MGTLGCVNDMLLRDKENRELHKLGRERLKDTRNSLLKIRDGANLPDISVEKMDKIQKITVEKEAADKRYLFKIKTIVVLIIILLVIAINVKLL